MSLPVNFHQMNESQQLAYLKSRANMKPGEQTGDGLVMHVRHDNTGREIREFKLAPGATKRDSWMAPFCKEGELQERIFKQPATRPRQYAGSSPIEQPAAWSKP